MQCYCVKKINEILKQKKGRLTRMSPAFKILGVGIYALSFALANIDGLGETKLTVSLGVSDLRNTAKMYIHTHLCLCHPLPISIAVNCFYGCILTGRIFNA